LKIILKKNIFLKAEHNLMGIGIKIIALLLTESKKLIFQKNLD